MQEEEASHKATYPDVLMTSPKDEKLNVKGKHGFLFQVRKEEKDGKGRKVHDDWMQKQLQLVKLVKFKNKLWVVKDYKENEARSLRKQPKTVGRRYLPKAYRRLLAFGNYRRAKAFGNYRRAVAFGNFRREKALGNFRRAEAFDGVTVSEGGITDEKGIEVGSGTGVGVITTGGGVGVIITRGGRGSVAGVVEGCTAGVGVGSTAGVGGYTVGVGGGPTDDVLLAAVDVLNLVLSLLN
ncbi:hypothetical protein LR48_Vigan553s001500 [Vigna angularis]|uniref:Uncharacterized protein n=1 Tax=Phaseolus angularis TaxID=3914 RepID=A0A0L9TDW4_PHAAN|nr:hypothetical protein LR48_Vigan553s001500 [Vigna angularis]